MKYILYYTYCYSLHSGPAHSNVGVYDSLEKLNDFINSFGKTSLIQSVRIFKGEELKVKKETEYETIKTPVRTIYYEIKE